MNQATEIGLAVFAMLCAGVAVHYAQLAGRAARFVVSQLAPAPKAPHPYDCPHCGEPFKQRSWKPTEGERGFCGRCLVWHQVFPPIDAPGGS